MSELAILKVEAGVKRSSRALRSRPSASPPRDRGGQTFRRPLRLEGFPSSGINRTGGVAARHAKAVRGEASRKLHPPEIGHAQIAQAGRRIMPENRTKKLARENCCIIASGRGRVAIGRCNATLTFGSLEILLMKHSRLVRVGVALIPAFLAAIVALAQKSSLPTKQIEVLNEKAGVASEVNPDVSVLRFRPMPCPIGAGLGRSARAAVGTDFGEEIEPNDTVATATALPLAANGRFGRPLSQWRY